MINQNSIDIAIKNLGNDIYLIFLVLAILNKNTGIGAIRGGYYKESHLLNDLNLYFSQKFPNKFPLKKC